MPRGGRLGVAAFEAMPRPNPWCSRSSRSQRSAVQRSAKTDLPPPAMRPMATTRMTITHLVTVLHDASVGRAAGLPLLLLVEALGIEGTSRCRNTGKKGKEDEGGSNGLHGTSPSLGTRANIIVARQQRPTGSASEARQAADKGALINRQLRRQRCCGMLK
jgi:hypothetical protein